MPQDGVALHAQARKALDWTAAAADWPAVDDLPAGLPDLQALHTAYVERFDAARDRERADRILAAIEAVGARAREGAPLSWDGLREVQAIALGVDAVGFRTEPAYANARMERYGCHPRLEGAFAKAIGQADDSALHPLLEACRVLLDVRFFHPFADGNGAAARLACQWVLQRAGVRLPELTPLLRLPVHPGVEEEYRALLDLAGSLLRRARG